MEEFWKCYCFPGLIILGISFLCFLIAYVVYWVLLILFRRIFRKKGLARTIVEELRYPVLFVFLEIAAIVSVTVLGFKERFAGIIEHAIVVLILISIGWVLAKLTHAVFTNIRGKLEKEAAEDHTRRSMLTQVLFLYRAIIFTVVTVTLAAILISFPHIKSIGVGILGSAGIIGIALGIAARPILLNLIAGFQVALTKTIKIGDAVIVEGDFARIESIHLTHVVAKTWDLRRIILPISYFIDHPFQNWDAEDPELLGSVYLYCDYSVPVEAVRQKVGELVEASPDWNGNVWKVHVTNCSEKTMELRLIMTAKDAGTAFALRSYVREHLIAYLQEYYPHALPCIRYRKLEMA